MVNATNIPIAQRFIILGRILNIRSTPINISDSSTYTTEEKGTDINVAVNMLSKAYTNAYDIAILVSGDTDYVPVVQQLHNIGKIVVLATLPHQNVSKYPHRQ